jgi:hypothetical protein
LSAVASAASVAVRDVVDPSEMVNPVFATIVADASPGNADPTDPARRSAFRVSAFNYGQWWLAVPESELLSRKFQQEVSENIAAADAAFAQWAPRVQALSVADASDATPAAERQPIGEYFAIIKSRVNIERTRSPLDDGALTFSDELIQMFKRT